MKDNCLGEVDPIRKKILELLGIFNVPTAISSLFVLHYIISPIPMNPFVDKGCINHLIGLSSTIPLSKKRNPTITELKQLEKYLIEFVVNFSDTLLSNSLNNKEDIKTDLKFRSILNGMVRQINDGGYQFQFDEYVEELTSLDVQFYSVFGFKVSDLKECCLNIMRYQMNGIFNIVKALHITKNPSDYDVNERWNIIEKLISGDYLEKLHFDIEDITNTSKKETFSKIIEKLSFNESGIEPSFDSPISKNPIFERPLIKLWNGKFYLPSQPLIMQYHLFIENWIKESTDERLKEKFKETKSNYVEIKTAEFFSRVYGKDYVFSKQFYKIENRSIEIDNLVIFDEYIFVVESKSKYFTPPSFRGGDARLSSELKSIIGDASVQVNNLKNLLENGTVVEFFDKKGRKTFSIDNSNKNKRIIPIIVTLEPLSHLLINQSHTLNLEFLKDHPLILSIFDLDIITRHISSKNILLHFFLERKKAQGNVISSSELELLGFYLENGFLSGFKPKMIPLIIGYCFEFDNYYNQGINSQVSLKIEPEILFIIKDLEFKNFDKQTVITQILLNFYPETRNQLINKINDLTFKTMHDKQLHKSFITFSDTETNNIDTIMLIVSGTNNKQIEEKIRFEMMTNCLFLKYKVKAKRIIGFGKNVNLPDFVTTYYLLIDEKNIYDEEMERIVASIDFSRYGIG